ncbi:Hypothetical protein CAP_5753 [Chondromyces apiculatus DSM 436]|uniref:Uncharacterized protein n=1 Tax=Chondromyces apiculatus DSM 436 TaxID=1192034 RepID=A0A017T1V9_9BACT|nr:Hypothetical protein CAP_5753 [Chondromyces apiculatus DSM 436]
MRTALFKLFEELGACGAPVDRLSVSFGNFARAPGQLICPGGCDGFVVRLFQA